MGSLNDWDVTDANNNDTPPDGWPENMNYSEVNNTGRAVQGTLKRFFSDINGSLNGGGIADVYTITLNESYAAYFDGMIFRGSISVTSTVVAPTINVNGIGVATLVDMEGDALRIGALKAGRIYLFQHDGTNMRVSEGAGVLSVEESNHQRAGFQQLYVGSTERSQDIPSIVAESAWESIGPTGSGADNIWTDLDLVPAHATALLINVDTTIESDGGGVLSTLDVYLRQNGSTIGTNGNSQAAALQTDNVSGHRAADINIVTVPIDGDLTFDLFWAATNDNARSIVISYRGFISD